MEAVGPFLLPFGVAFVCAFVTSALLRKAQRWNALLMDDLDEE